MVDRRGPIVRGGAGMLVLGVSAFFAVDRPTLRPVGNQTWPEPRSDVESTVCGLPPTVFYRAVGASPVPDRERWWVLPAVEGAEVRVSAHALGNSVFIELEIQNTGSAALDLRDASLSVTDAALTSLRVERAPACQGNTSKRIEPVAAFYAQVGGMAVGAMDRELFCFWQRGDLEVVVSVDAGQRWTGTLFCDWSIWALGYAFGPAADPRVAIVDGVARRFVAATFTEFVELYLADDRRLYG